MNWVAKLYLWSTHRLYNQFAWAYDPVSWAISGGRWALIRRMALEHTIGERVLELGFGTGELLIEMAEHKIQLYGLEPSPAMQRITIRKMNRSGFCVPRVYGLAQQTPFCSRCFNTIIATFPAEYITDPETYHEVARLLCDSNPNNGTSGGRFIIIGAGFSTEHVILRRILGLIFGLKFEKKRYGLINDANKARFQVRVLTGKCKYFNTPIIILDKKPPDFFEYG